MDTNNTDSDPKFSKPNFDLTKREIEILQCSANGLSMEKTGTILFISADTVESHRTKIIKKMNAANITEAVSIAFRNKLIN